jgi:RNA polymerase subunit RPABC4/transcription elongation factor Spt4
MRCAKCGGNLDGDARNCPRCGEPVVTQRLAGMMKTSTILISAENVQGVYHSVEDIPEPLRKKLLRSTNSLNSRTMLIADRRGRQEIARALKKLPGASRRRLSDALAGKTPEPSLPKPTLAKAMGILLAGAVGLAAWWIIGHNW